MDYRISWVLNTTPLYKIMPLKWFKVMIEEKCNTLLRPASWDDPQEMNYSNSVIATEQGNVPLDASHWFGQSWSLCVESAIMWQAFKKDKEPYVKIRIDASNLIRGLIEQNNNLRIAVLEYIRYFNSTTNDYKEKIKDVKEMHPWPVNFTRRGVTLAELYPMYNLLTKRDFFKHEEEVRLLLFDKSSSEEQKFVKYPIDPTTISEVVIDPWTSIDNEKFTEIKNDLRINLPNETTEIRKSDIYSDNCKFTTRYIISKN
ncbi:MAG: hypothetical protein K6A93_06350 [Bacteroidaceae bacterium]|nr:hypothetical protein [Bacteroidaceae bacterium]